MIEIFLENGVTFVKKFGDDWDNKDDHVVKGSLDVRNIVSEMSKDYLCEIWIPPISKEVEFIDIGFAVLTFKSESG